jgi:lipoprotein NlpD
VLARVCLGLLLCSLLACGGNTRAPVEDRNARSKPTSRVYRVQRGETLYSIAFRYGLDYRKVAAANSIAAPYTIYPGQTIYLKEATPPPVRRTTAPPATSASRSATSTAKPAPRPAAAAAPKSAPKTTTKTAPVTPSSSTPVTKSRSGGTYSGAAVRAWRWPTSGRVTRGYSASVHKGIDIGGQRGDAIQAVAAGKVVYAGTGIVGFGELLIVKHNAVYLSAYGHNSRLLVAEGATVRAGQKIAEKGSSGTDTVKLHFEIRKEGKPIDPQRVLPRR